MDRRDVLVAFGALALAPSTAWTAAIAGARPGRVAANGIDFAYLEMGRGPLALCLHGFPDSPQTYRHLLPALAAEGYRAVAVYMRGFHPTGVPQDGRYDSAALASDPAALHDALGGDRNAVLIAHDWGAVAAYGTLAAAPDRWRRAVIGNVPPWGTANFTYDQIKRSFYFWFFQLAAAEFFLGADDFAFIDGLWRDWSPATTRPTIYHAKACLREPGHLRAALGYYRSFFEPARFGTPQWAEEQTAAWGRPVQTPVLYLHGTNDGCIGLDAVAVDRFAGTFRGGYEFERIEGAGHFFLVERPQIASRIASYLSGS
ncbi:MAG: alpha/beta hydrolase [Betaproteobacteria bacterium]|nr:alpha/beta hydrolase [Betaproteobacteria bacterium]